MFHTWGCRDAAAVFCEAPSTLSPLQLQEAHRATTDESPIKQKLRRNSFSVTYPASGHIDVVVSLEIIIMCNDSSDKGDTIMSAPCCSSCPPFCLPCQAVLVSVDRWTWTASCLSLYLKSHSVRIESSILQRVCIDCSLLSVMPFSLSWRQSSPMQEARQLIQSTRAFRALKSSLCLLAVRPLLPVLQH